MAEHIAALESELRRVCNPLPGSHPRDNHRPVNIRHAHNGWFLLDALVDRFPQISPAVWEARCNAGRFVDQPGAVCGKDHRVRAGEQLVQVFPLEIEPPVATDIRVLYADDALMAVVKPAPLPMHPSGRFHRNTLQHIINLACTPHVVRPVHRLDANTTGIVLLARTREACRHLQQQFLAGSVVKRYLVRVTGHPANDTFFCAAPISNQPCVLGTHSIDELTGRTARTDFQVDERCADGTSLLEAVLGTGRTNQIRLHLWHLGHPVAGDPAYLAGGLLGDTQTLAPTAPPLQLHAWQLTCRHPTSGELLHFGTARPDWARVYVDN